MRNQVRSRGFTFVEMAVMIAVFGFVMVIAVGSILAILHGNRKARNEVAAVNNVQTAIESMVRTIRDGSNFHCGPAPYSSPRACTTNEAATEFAVDPNGPNTLVVFRYNATNKTIERSVNSSSAWQPITSAPVTIDTLTFRTTSITSGANPRPQVLITISGSTGTTGTKEAATFSIQTTVAERLKQVPTASDTHDVIISEF